MGQDIDRLETLIGGDLDSEAELAKLQDAGESWYSHAMSAIKRIESFKKIYPGQSDKASMASLEYSGVLINFLSNSQKLDDMDISNAVLRLHIATEHHNQSAWAAQLGIALANRDKIEVAEKLIESDIYVVEEYQDQVLLAIAASHARRGSESSAIECMKRAYCTGYGGINGRNIAAFDKVYSAIIASEVQPLLREIDTLV